MNPKPAATTGVCGVCAAPVNGPLCGRHLDQLVRVLRDFAVGPEDLRGERQGGLIDDLAALAGRQVRGQRGPQVRRSRAHPLPVDPDAVNVAVELSRILLRWHMAVVGPAGAERHNAARLAAALADVPDAIAGHPDAAIMHGEIMALHERVVRLLDRGSVERVVLGVCGSGFGADRCRGTVSAPVDEEWARCSSCGGRTAVQERRQALNAALDAQTYTVAELIALAPTATGNAISRTTVDSWVHRGRLRPAVNDAGEVMRRDGHAVYRWADYAAIVTRHTPRSPKKAA